MRGRTSSRWVWLLVWLILHGVAIVSLHGQRQKLASHLIVGAEAEVQPLKIRIHEADPKGMVDVPYRITYEIIGSDLRDVSVISRPSGANMERVYDDAVSRGKSVSIINGKVSQSEQLFYTYTFVPHQKGKITISGFSVKGKDGKTVSAPNHQLTIEANNHPQGREQRPQRMVGRKPSLLYRVIPSQKSVYENELFSVVYRIYTNTTISNHRLDQAPDFKDFISKEVNQNLSQRNRVEEYNGQHYSVVDYFVSLLEADSAGTKILPTSKVTLYYPSGNESNDVFLNEVVSQSLSTEPVAIEVKPLPEAGKPKDFSGVVGRFEIVTSPERSTLRTGSAMTLKLLVEGEGNLSRLSTPKLELPLELEAYPPKESLDVKLEQGKILSTKEFVYSLVAHKAGEYIIPSVSFSYFDPTLKAYKIASTKPIHIKAEGEAIREVGVYQSAETGEIERLSRMDGVGENSLQGADFARSYLYLLCYLGLSVLTYVVYYLLSHRLKAMADVEGWRASRAEKLAKRRLRSALLALKRGDEHQAVEELLSALWGYLGDKLHLPTSQLTRDNIGTLLSSNGVSEDLSREVLTLIDEMEFVRFAPSSAHADPMDLYKRAEGLIVRLEQNKLVVHA